MRSCTQFIIATKHVIKIQLLAECLLVLMQTQYSLKYFMSDIGSCINDHDKTHRTKKLQLVF